ncbi:MAG: aminotransferase class V-fold PLP-dependent enzyme [Phycisphaeraceae bacterium]
MADAERPLVYLDHAATSWPKSEAVLDAMVRFAREGAGNPGRSGHRLAVSAGRVVSGARGAISRLMGVGDPSRVVFGQNGTDALNLAIVGMAAGLEGRFHVVTTALEHNSVMRPLETLRRAGRVELTAVEFDAEGFVSASEVLGAVREETRLVVMSHASNVLGTVQPVEEVAAGLVGRDVLLCVDAAQTAGVVPIEMGGLGADLLAFSGHKGLGGPTGTGVLCLSERATGRVRAVRSGGTGGDSISTVQPEGLPERLEAGTANTIGLAGLLAAIEIVEAEGVAGRWDRERALRDRLVAGLRGIGGVRVLGPVSSEGCVGVVSFVAEGMEAGTLAGVLDSSFGIAVRDGLHCSPGVHGALGLLPEGAVRVSVGPGTTGDEVDALVGALSAVLG